MNIAVVDDEARSREALLHYVEKYSKETGRVLSVECFATADEFLSVYKKNFFFGSLNGYRTAGNRRACRGKRA